MPYRVLQEFTAPAVTALLLSGAPEFRGPLQTTVAVLDTGGVAETLTHVEPGTDDVRNTGMDGGHVVTGEGLVGDGSLLLFPDHDTVPVFLTIQVF